MMMKIWPTKQVGCAQHTITWLVGSAHPTVILKGDI